MTQEVDPLRPHRHDPNLQTPAGDGSLRLLPSGGNPLTIAVADLRRLPLREIPRFTIVSTGHGTSGPFSFGGAALQDVVSAWAAPLPAHFSVEVVSADGFGNRIEDGELRHPPEAGPILLAFLRDGAPLTRDEGLVRLIVPSETKDALRQVKWVSEIRVVAHSR